MNKSKQTRPYLSILILLIAGLSPLSYSSSALPKNYQISCGIAQKLSQTFEIIKVSTDIPFITEKQNPNFYFGCTVKAKDLKTTSNKPFTIHGQLTLPASTSATFQSAIGYSEKTVNDSLIINTTPIYSTLVDSKQTAFLVFQFDNNDRPGSYLVDVYVDSAIVKRVEFKVSIH